MSESPLIRLGILVGPKGRGSNMRAIIRACEQEVIPAHVAVVISPKSGTPAVQCAEEHGTLVQIVPPEEAYYGNLLVKALKDEQVDLVCLAGYLRMLPTEVLDAFPNRVLNIHPALLPKFGGKGMYGMHVHEAVVASDEIESGCTVHLVTQHYDEGEIILQLKTELNPSMTAEDVAQKVLELEHRAYPQAIKIIIDKLHGTQPSP